MANKIEAADAFQRPEIQYWRPAGDRRGIGSFRLPMLLQSGPLTKFNVFQYEGDTQVEIITKKYAYEDDVIDDIDAEEEPQLPADAIDKDIDTDARETTTPDEDELLKFEKRKGNVGRWLTRLECPKALTKYLVGRQGVNKEAFEEEFPGVQVKFDRVLDMEAVEEKGPQQRRTNIFLPNVAREMIELRHETSKRVLLQARRAMLEQIKASMHHLPYTHFISLPFLQTDNEELMNRFAIFKDRVMTVVDQMADRVDRTIFSPPGQLHFTLCMLRLYYDWQLAAAIKALANLQSNDRVRVLMTDELPEDMAATEAELPPSGFYVHLKGIEVMGDEASRTDVLYTMEDRGDEVSLETQKQWIKSEQQQWTLWMMARKSATSYIVTLCEELVQELHDAELLDGAELQRQKLLGPGGQLELKLHVTVMNSKFREARHAEMEDDDPHMRRTAFNADTILRTMKDFDFGIGKISGIHLSRRGTAAADTKYYHAETIIPLRPGRGL